MLRLSKRAGLNTKQFTDGKLSGYKNELDRVMMEMKKPFVEKGMALGNQGGAMKYLHCLLKYFTLTFFIFGEVFMPNPSAAQNKQQKAIFAGGCFWCMEQSFKEMTGVVTVTSGYTGGTKINPSYEDVISGTTGHREAIEIVFDPARICYEQLLDVFWKSIDPTDPNGQFADQGNQYKTAIYYFDNGQKIAAEESKKALQDARIFSKPIQVDILPAGKFYPAESYHQDYYKKNPLSYKLYKKGSGREDFIKKTWQGRENLPICPIRPKAKTSGLKPGKKELEQKLIPEQYRVTQQCGTETPFANEYWNHKKDGIYVDVVSGEPLFLSSDKFDSGSGWPSFTKPLEPGNIVEKKDLTFGMIRTEVRSKQGDSHLGHVFPERTTPTGQYFCINSAALRFIPKEEMEKQGYGRYLKYFSQ